MQIASTQEIRRAEQAAFAAGSSTPSELMDAVVTRLCREVTGTPQRVVAYIGRGNNGGDAVGLAASFCCQVILRHPGESFRVSAETRRQLDNSCCMEETATAAEPEADTLIIDGLLGTGAHGELTGEYAACVQEMNALRLSAPRCRTLAIDIPSGLGTSLCVQADATAAIGCVKPEALADGAEDFVGRLHCIPLPEVDIPAECADTVLEPLHPLCRLPRRPYSLYKNRAGRVAVVAGSRGYLGAAQMCAEAAVRAGAGLVALYCHEDMYPLLAARVAPEVMVRPVKSYAEISEPDAQCLLMGPGLGAVAGAEADALHALAMDFPGTVVLDADALNLAAARGWAFHERCILTPHPGEMQRLDPRPAAPRRETVRRFLERHNCTLLLKGARSIAANRTHACYNSTGGPFMANGGQGDTLSGCIAALAAQGLGRLHAAALGAYACGLAAETVQAAGRGTHTVRATQVADALPAVLASLHPGAHSCE